MNQVRGLGPPVLLVDGGDCFFGAASKKAPPPAEEKRDLRIGRAILNAYNLLGYQALALGPTDFQLGLGVLRDFEKEARFPFLCANLVDKATQKPLFKPYVILEAGGIKYGIYAVLMPLQNETYKNRVLPDTEILDPEKVTAEVVAELKKSCDVIVALSHLNVDANERILAANPGIDVLIDPLSRNGMKAIWVGEDEYCRELHGTPVLRIDGQGSRVGCFEMFFTKGARRISAYRGYDSALEPHLMRHPEMTRLLAEFERERKAPWPIAFDTEKPRLTDEFLGEEGCGGCHEEQHKFWQSTQHAATYATIEKTGDHQHLECAGCHTFGYGVTFADLKNPGKFKEVQCENCHVSRAGHAENPKLVTMGAVGDEACWGCHNPAITKAFTEKDFDYASALPRASCPKIKR